MRAANGMSWGRDAWRDGVLGAAGRWVENVHVTR